MIWLIKGDESHIIVSSNIFKNDTEEMHEVWVTRPNGKNLKVFSHQEEGEARLLKEAIDYAVKHKESTFTIE